MYALIFKTKTRDSKPVFCVIPYNGEDLKIPASGSPTIIKEMYRVSGILVASECASHKQARDYVYRAGGKRM